MPVGLPQPDYPAILRTAYIYVPDFICHLLAFRFVFSPLQVLYYLTPKS
jgi:hypothetical protein